ncbi:MAG: hypothetical protein IPL23_30540 [Saprospiraceae bacterium]|nr:hypothetical protein [Saprospiraceae bacterium]
MTVLLAVYYQVKILVKMMSRHGSLKTIASGCGVWTRVSVTADQTRMMQSPTPPQQAAGSVDTAWRNVFYPG